MAVLFAEDVEVSTKGTVASLRGNGQPVLEARSIRAGVRTLEENDDVLCATIDQRMPFEEDDEHDATEPQVDDFARYVGERMPFLWLTAHDVSSGRMEIPGCLGVVAKAGDVTGAVMYIFTREVPGFELKGDGKHLDQVMLEVTSAGPHEYSGRILAWKPEPFPMRRDLLPVWLSRLAEDQAPRSAFAKVRASLVARRPGQLDLCAYEMIPTRPVGDADIWDD